MKKQLLFFALFVLGLSLVAQTPRMSLFEEFTGENCGPCASANPGVNAILAASTNTPKVIAIKWQVAIPSAPTATWSLYRTNSAEINARMSYYGVTFAPESRMDGQGLSVFGGSSNHAGDFTNGVISTAQAIMSPFSIAMSRSWDPGCNAVTLTVTVTASQNYTATSSLKFRTVMVERVITFATAPGSNGEKIFHDAAIKSFPSIQNGIALNSSWVSGQTQTFTVNCPIPSYTRNKNEIAFVGFIQADGNKNVLQAMRLDKIPFPTDVLTAVDAKVNVTCSNTISPTITLKNTGPNPFTSFTITPYTDGIAGATTAWSGNLAVNSTTTLVLNTVSTSTTNGVHTFSYSLNMNNPYYLNIQSNSVKYLVASNFQGSPVVQDFGLALFPPASWTMINPNNGPTFGRDVSTGSYGNPNEIGCVKFDFFNNAVIGDQDELYLPPSDLSGTATPTLSFDYAYAQKSGENDRLEVLISNDCGITWTSVFDKAGQNLATVGALTASFTAAASSDWTTASINLTGFASANALVKFKVTNDHGNNLFIDNVNMAQPSTAGIKANSRDNNTISIYPNPATNETSITIKSDMAIDNATFKIIDVIGKVYNVKQINLLPGINSYKIDTKDLATGVYFVSLETGKSVVSKKLMISK